MEKMLVVVFDNEDKAKKGANALKDLDQEGTISVYSEAIIKKNQDGTVKALDARDDWPIDTVGGTAIGSLIGLLGGPVGVVVGASTGMMVGAVGDVHRSGVSADFLEDVAGTLSSGKYALVADISEDYIVPVDIKMDEIGGEVFRTRTEYLEDIQMEKDIAELDADIDAMEKEMADSRADHKAKLQAKIQKAKQKRDKKVQRLKQRKDQLETERKQKVESLRVKASKAHAEKKAAVEARITQINNSYHNTVAKAKNSQADKLDKMSDRLDRKAQQLRTAPAQ